MVSESRRWNVDMWSMRGIVHLRFQSCETILGWEFGACAEVFFLLPIVLCVCAVRADHLTPAHLFFFAALMAQMRTYHCQHKELLGIGDTYKPFYLSRA